MAEVKSGAAASFASQGPIDRGFEVRGEIIVKAAKVMFACGVTHVVVDRILGWVIDPVALARLSRQDRLYLPEKFVSTAHGMVVGLGALHLIFQKKLWAKDVFRPYSTACDDIFVTTLGYSLYDMVIMYLHGGEPRNMWAHHVAEALGCFLMTCYRQAAFFPMMFAVTEVTVLPANILWLAQKFGRSDNSKVVPAFLLLRFLAFLVFRAFILPYTIKYAVDRGNFVKNVKETNAVVSVLSAANMGLLGFLNMYWTFLMIKNARKLFGPTSQLP